MFLLNTRGINLKTYSPTYVGEEAKYYLMLKRLPLYYLDFFDQRDNLCWDNFITESYSSLCNWI